MTPAEVDEIEARAAWAVSVPEHVPDHLSVLTVEQLLAFTVQAKKDIFVLVEEIRRLRRGACGGQAGEGS